MIVKTFIRDTLVYATLKPGPYVDILERLAQESNSYFYKAECRDHTTALQTLALGEARPDRATEWWRRAKEFALQTDYYHFRQEWVRQRRQQEALLARRGQPSTPADSSAAFAINRAALINQQPRPAGCPIGWNFPAAGFFYITQDFKSANSCRGFKNNRGQWD